MIFIMGAPGTGKTTLAAWLSEVTCGTLICTDDYLEVRHELRPQTIAAGFDGTLIVEGCEVDRLIKHGLVPAGSLVLCTGFEARREGCAGLAARCRKYFEAYDGPKYFVKSTYLYFRKIDVFVIS